MPTPVPRSSTPAPPRSQGFFGRVLGAVENAVTPDRGTPSWQSRDLDQPTSLGQYLSSTAHSFDPRTAGGLVNLASMLLPGGRLGERPFVGEHPTVTAAIRAARDNKQGFYSIERMQNGLVNFYDRRSGLQSTWNPFTAEVHSGVHTLSPQRVLHENTTAKSRAEYLRQASRR